MKITLRSLTQNSLILTLSFSLTSCATKTQASQSEPKQKTYSRNFAVDDEHLWRAVVKTLEPYTITVANRENGFLKTDWSPFYLGEIPNQERFLASSDDGLRHLTRLNIYVRSTGSETAPQSTIEIRKEVLSYNKIVGAREPALSDHIEENEFANIVNANLAQLK